MADTDQPRHTPGPWGLCAHLETHDECCGCGYRGSIWSADGKLIVCELGSSPDADGNGVIQGHTQPQADRQTQFADAHLIAAAPDLYAACKDIESKLIDYGLRRINWRPDDFLMRVRAAMAKAEARS